MVKSEKTNTGYINKVINFKSSQVHTEEIMKTTNY